MSKYVTRKYEVKSGEVIPTNEIIIKDDLESMRDKMESLGLTNIGRSPEDGEHIVEAWI